MRSDETVFTRRITCLALGAVACVAGLGDPIGRTDVLAARHVNARVAADDSLAGAADFPQAGLAPESLWGGTTNRVAADGAVGYVARTLAIDVVDLAADPPRAIGRRLFAERVTAIAAEPGRLYVACGPVLIVYDASRPARLSEIGRWTLPADAGEARSITWIAAADGSLVLSASPARAPFKGYPLVVVDAADPRRLRSIAEVPVEPDDASAGLWRAGLWRAGDRLAVVTGRNVPNEPFTSRVDVFDLHDPSAPRFVGRLGPFNDFVAASLRGHLLYVAVTFGPQMWGHRVEATAGVRVFDIAAPDAPRLVGRWDANALVAGMVMLRDRALLTILGQAPEDGVWRCVVLDTTGDQPTESGSRPCPVAPGLGISAASVESAGRLLVAAYSQGWEVWAWPDRDPVALARSGDGQSAWDVAANGRRLLVYDGDAVRLLTQDGAGGLAEAELAIDAIRTFPMILDAWTGAVALSDDHAIVAGEMGMVVFDVATSPPRQVGQLAWGLSPEVAQPLVAALIGNVAVVDLYVPGHGMAVVDLSDPAHPVWRTTPWDGLPVWDMTVDEGRLYVGAGPRLYAFTPGGPSGLTLLGETLIGTTDGGERDVMAVAARGDRAVIGGIQYVAMLHVSDPANIRMTADHAVDNDVSDLAFVGDDVVAAGSRNGPREWVGRLSLLRGDTAEAVADVRTVAEVQGLATIDDVVYAAEGSLGLVAFRPWRRPDGWGAVVRLALPWVGAWAW